MVGVGIGKGVGDGGDDDHNVGGLRSAGARRGGVWAFAGWDAQGRELPYQRLRSEAGLVRPRPLRASAWAGDSEKVSARPDEVPWRVRRAWGWRTSTRTSEEEDGDGSHVRPRPGKGGPLAWLWKRIKNAFGDG